MLPLIIGIGVAIISGVSYFTTKATNKKAKENLDKQKQKAHEVARKYENKKQEVQETINNATSSLQTIYYNTSRHYNRFKDFTSIKQDNMLKLANFYVGDIIPCLNLFINHYLEYKNLLSNISIIKKERTILWNKIQDINFALETYSVFNQSQKRTDWLNQMHEIDFDNGDKKYINNIVNINNWIQENYQKKTNDVKQKQFNHTLNKLRNIYSSSNIITYQIRTLKEEVKFYRKEKQDLKEQLGKLNINTQDKLDTLNSIRKTLIQLQDEYFIIKNSVLLRFSLDDIHKELSDIEEKREMIINNMKNEKNITHNEIGYVKQQIDNAYLHKTYSQLDTLKSLRTSLYNKLDVIKKEFDPKIDFITTTQDALRNIKNEILNCDKENNDKLKTIIETSCSLNNLLNDTWSSYRISKSDIFTIKPHKVKTIEAKNV